MSGLSSNNKLHTLSNDKHVINFYDKDDALSFQKAFPNDGYVYKESILVSHLSAKGFINWSDIPRQFNFIYRDSDGVCASFYLPSKSKWFNSNYSHYRLYGGERLILPHKDYHELFKLGDVFERPYGKTNHFINWKKIKGAHHIRFYDRTDSEAIDVMDYDGNLLFSGDNLEVNIINKKATFRFNTFFAEKHTFVKDDYI
jgi:hypothetical protein